jgi:hypothetical protein
MKWAQAISSGYTTPTNPETPFRYRIRAFDPLRTRVLVDTCRSCQQEERVCRLEVPAFRLSNPITPGEIERTNAGTQVLVISSSQTGYHGLNFYGSRSGTTHPTHPSHILPNRRGSRTGSIRHSSSQSQIPSNSTPTPLQPPPPKHPAAEPAQAQPQSQTPPRSPPKTDDRPPVQKSSVSKSFRFGP